ncbi:DUF5819 family protein [Lihuaxuella thermophila]|uniref:Uncharacterized protein n=1 Tax=Lihuaxuella thermophila TaxID=1173111 RepID=A0A1H8C7D7_9BACL|nr:DUF5819 family protein [Lihuaxuella thermophila]SEM90799.1 hypothetical protein SAMN05444955_103110 [Lihuaxuella thermophila]
MLRKKLILVVCSLLGLFLCFHFAMVAVHLSPRNPFKERISAAINGYMNPVFKQGWYLFAPNPVNRHESLQIKARYTDAAGRPRETDWLDISKPMVREIRANRLSPKSRLLVYESKLIDGFLSDEPAARRKAEKRLGAYASYLLQKRLKIKGHISEVRVRVVVNKFPRFKERHQPDSKGILYYHYTSWIPFGSVGQKGEIP